MFKRAKVVMLPTNEKANALIAKSINHDIISLIYKDDDKYNQWLGQHLYIISDEEIKNSDKFMYNNDYILTLLSKDSITSFYISEERYNIDNSDWNPKYCKKIIASTDTSLNLPQPSQSFINKYIEEYNKSNKIEDIMVEYEDCEGTGLSINKYCSNSNTDCLKCKGYLKVNPKDNTITIKKIKDSWNREEISNIIRRFENEYHELFGNTDINLRTIFVKNFINKL